MLEKSIIESTKNLFVPNIAYNECLDTITLLLRDCSYTEEFINKDLSILYANHKGKFDFVGLVIHTAKVFLDKNNIDGSEVEKIVKSLNSWIVEYTHL